MISDDYLNNPKIIKKEVFKFNFSTLMLFRCTQRKYAEQFKQGNLFFNTPKSWIGIGDNEKCGIGDKLEGTFLCTNINDNSDFIENLKKQPDITDFNYNNMTYFRRNDISDLFCLCLYSLNDNSFNEKDYDRKGRVQYISRIEQSYFTAFSNDLSKGNYSSIPEDEQPVVICINNPHLFFEKIKSTLYNIGLNENEIIISPIEYIDKRETSLAAVPYPLELLLKDKSYKKQSEIRIIINTKRDEVIEYFIHNNIIKIGNINDIVDVYDYYFNDLIIARNLSKTIIFNLPNEIVEPFESLPLNRLLSIIIQTQNDDLPVPPKNPIEKYALIKAAKKVIFDRYKTDVKINGNEILFSNINKELAKQLDENQLPELKEKETHIELDEIIENKKYDLLEKRCIELKNDPETFDIASYYHGLYYFFINDYINSIRLLTICIDRRYRVNDCLSLRADNHFRMGDYNKALNDNEMLQDVVGYNAKVYSNKGICYLYLNNLDKAINEFNESIKLKHKNAFAYYNRSIAYLRKCDYKAAKKDIHKALKYDPKNDLYKTAFYTYYRNL